MEQQQESVLYQCVVAFVERGSHEIFGAEASSLREVARPEKADQ